MVEVNAEEVKEVGRIITASTCFFSRADGAIQFQMISAHNWEVFARLVE